MAQINFIKDSAGNLLKNGDNKLLLTRPVEEQLLPLGLIGEYDSENIEIVGSSIRTAWNLVTLPEIITFTVTNAATSTGNILITTGGVAYPIAITSGDSTNTIAAKVRATTFANTIVSGSTNTFTLTKVTHGRYDNTTFSANGVTGVNMTSLMTQGGNLISYNIAYQPIQVLNVMNSRPSILVGNMRGLYHPRSDRLKTLFVVFKRENGIQNDMINVLGPRWNQGMCISQGTQVYWTSVDVKQPIIFNGKYYATQRTVTTPKDLPSIISPARTALLMHNSSSYWSFSLSLIGELGIASTMRAHVMAAAVYNRVLTDEEIIHNHRALGQRYAITMDT